jgi:cephalosporin hydroxylase
VAREETVRHGRPLWKGAAAAGLILVTSACLAFLYERLLARVPRTPAQVVEAFHELYYNLPSTWLTTHWLGILTGQNPNDIWVTQEIITEVRPDFIVETGTFRGGSAAIWAMVLEQVNPFGRVITIDINDFVDKTSMPPILRTKVDFLIGSSVDPQVVQEVTRRVKGKKVLVILDSDHRMHHVLKELQAYAPLVGVGSYIIVQDTNVNGHPVRPGFGPGPMEAVEEFLKTHDAFTSDPTRERLLFTMHPKGYLKRVE